MLREKLKFSKATEHGKTIHKKRSEMESYFIKLTSPIAVAGEISGTIKLGNAVFHPPISWNPAEFSTEDWASILHSNGFLKSETHLKFIGTAPSGKFSDGVTLKYGLRVDIAQEAKIWRQVDEFQNLIREVTHQWWILSPRNPFDLGLRFMTQLDERMQTLEGYPDQGYDMMHPWIPAAALQTKVSFESALDQSRWDLCKNFSERGIPRDNATQTFLNAISHYFLHQDNLFVLNCAAAVEIMETKLRTLSGQPTKSYGLRLRNGALLWKDKDEQILRNLFSDRGHIAHGRSPPFVTKDGKNIGQYLRLLESYFRRFLGKVRKFDWLDVATK